MDFLVTLLGIQPVVGSHYQGQVPAQPKRLCGRLAAQIVGAGMMRRIETGQDENFHRLDDQSLNRQGGFCQPD
jgi:hypothetical protein